MSFVWAAHLDHGSGCRPAEYGQTRLTVSRQETSPVMLRQGRAAILLSEWVS